MYGNYNNNRLSRYSDTLAACPTTMNDSTRDCVNGPTFKLKGPIRSVKVGQPDLKLPSCCQSPSQGSISTSDLIGRYRYKYFASPVFGKTSPGSTLDALEFTFPSIHVDAKSREPFHTEIVPPTRTRGTQTDYRDSECQTDPYSPPFFVNDAIQDPEILLLRNLTWGNGLPAGRLEVDMIGRARDRLKGMANVTGIADDNQETKKWNQLFQTTGTAIETWLYEEQCQERVRDSKLQMLAKSLENLRNRHGDLIQERLRTLWKRRYQEKEVKMAKIEAQKNREFRRCAGSKSMSDEFALSAPPSDNNNNAEPEGYFNESAPMPFKTGIAQNKIERRSLNNNLKSSHSMVNQRSKSFRYSDLASLERILPQVILSKGNSDFDCLRGGSVVTITNSSGRRNRLDRELEDAYLRILEKKRLSSNGFRKQILPPDKNTKNFLTNENAGTQTDANRNNPAVRDENTTDGQLDFYEEQLNVILTKLLQQHWEDLNEFFLDLLPRTTEEL